MSTARVPHTHWWLSSAITHLTHSTRHQHCDFVTIDDFKCFKDNISVVICWDRGLLYKCASIIANFNWPVLHTCKRGQAKCRVTERMSLCKTLPLSFWNGDFISIAYNSLNVDLKKLYVADIERSSRFLLLNGHTVIWSRQSKLNYCELDIIPVDIRHKYGHCYPVFIYLFSSYSEKY